MLRMFNQGPAIEFCSQNDSGSQCWLKMHLRIQFNLWPQACLFFGLSSHQGAATTSSFCHPDVTLTWSNSWIHCTVFVLVTITIKGKEIVFQQNKNMTHEKRTRGHTCSQLLLLKLNFIFFIVAPLHLDSFESQPKDPTSRLHLHQPRMHTFTHLFSQSYTATKMHSLQYRNRNGWALRNQVKKAGNVKTNITHRAAHSSRFLCSLHTGLSVDHQNEGKIYIR